MKKIVFILSAFLFIVACSENKKVVVEKTEEIIVDTQIELSKLDTILGDKILDQATDNIRLNNFKSFKNLTEGDLLVESKLYEVTAIETDLYLLKQKKIYTEARRFSAILKVEDGIVENYYVSNDFTIKDVERTDNSLFIISDDTNNHNSYWRYKKQVKMMKLDNGFNAEWEYKISSDDYGIEGCTVDVSNSDSHWDINVMPGSTMLEDIYRLELDELGVFKSVKWVSSSHLGTDFLTVDEKNEIFSNNIVNE